MRKEYLEKEAMHAIQAAVDSGATVVFPNALIAGDCVITHLLHRMGLLKNKKVKVLFVDTLHLFDETLQLIDDIQKQYGFEGHVTMAEGINGKGKEAKKMYDQVYGADLWKTNLKEYDRICKVEPF